MGSAGEAAVGEEADRIAQPLAYQGCCHAEHLAHAGAALGAFVPDHDDVSLFYTALRYRFHRLFFAFEDACGTLVREPGVAGDLEDAALRGQVALEDHEPTRLLQRALNGGYHVLARRLFGVLDLLGNGLAGRGELVAVHEAGVDEAAPNELCAPSTVETHGSIAAAGLEVGNDGGTAADPVEVVYAKGNVRLA